ncbi:MAG: serine hydrolase [Vicinamibacterales bacterium]
MRPGHAMLTFTRSLCVALLGAAALAAVPQSGLESDLRKVIAESKAEVAVAMRTLDGRAEVLIDPDGVFHAASTMKVPVMIELFTQATAGTLKLDDPLPVRNEFHSIVDSSVYTLSEGDDSDKAIYAAAGTAMPLRQLCEAMITVSSNFAANLLIERLTAAAIQKTVDGLGAGGMRVLRGVEDQKAFDQGLNNSTTARGLLTLFDRLAHGRAVDAASDATMVEVLKRQTFNDGIPAGVPAGTPVAHKTGTITRIHHDAGIVYARRPYVLVVLTRGFADEKASDLVIARLSRLTFAATQP